MARMRIASIRGMGTDHAQKMKGMGITNSDSLLAKAGSDSQRRQLAKDLGMEPSHLLEYVNRADLARIKGVGKQYANLLEEAGVDTVKELAHRRPDNLQQKLSEVASSRGVAKRPPTLREVESWVEQAKALAPVVTY